MLPHSHAVSVCVKRLVIETSAFNVENFSYPKAFRARYTRIFTGHYTQLDKLGEGGKTVNTKVGPTVCEREKT